MASRSCPFAFCRIQLQMDIFLVAARLESIAEPGGACISGSAYDQVRGRVEADFNDLGEKELKNIARPERVYAVRAGAAGSAPAAQLSLLKKSGHRVSPS